MAIYLVIQTLDQGMDRAEAGDRRGPVDLLKPAGSCKRNDVGGTEAGIAAAGNLRVASEIPPVCSRMNGCLSAREPATRAEDREFLDQRENYVAAARYAAGQALDCFTSTADSPFTCRAIANPSRPWTVRQALATARMQRRQWDRQHRIPRGRRIRPAGGIFVRAATSSNGCA